MAQTIREQLIAQGIIREGKPQIQAIERDLSPSKTSAPHHLQGISLATSDLKNLYTEAIKLRTKIYKISHALRDADLIIMLREIKRLIWILEKDGEITRSEFGKFTTLLKHSRLVLKRNQTQSTIVLLQKRELFQPVSKVHRRKEILAQPNRREVSVLPPSQLYAIEISSLRELRKKLEGGSYTKARVILREEADKWFFRLRTDDPLAPEGLVRLHEYLKRAWLTANTVEPYLEQRTPPKPVQKSETPVISIQETHLASNLHPEHHAEQARYLGFVDRVKKNARSRLFAMTGSQDAAFALLNEGARAHTHVNHEGLNYWQPRIDAPYFGRIEYINADGVARSALVGNQDFFIGEERVFAWQSLVGRRFANPASFEGTRLIRNLEVEAHTLEGVYDRLDQRNLSLESGVARESAKSLLHTKLESRGAMVLDDIVSTLAASQDDLLRLTHLRPLIINGVPGSGKTSLAFLRVAYLVYEESQTGFKANRVLFLAANRAMLIYSASQAAGLNIGAIQQTTFADFALERICDGNRQSWPSIIDDTLEQIQSALPNPAISEALLERSQILGSLGFGRILKRFAEQQRIRFAPRIRPALIVEVNHRSATVEFSVDGSVLTSAIQQCARQNRPYTSVRDRLIEVLNADLLTNPLHRQQRARLGETETARARLNAAVAEAVERVVPQVNVRRLMHVLLQHLKRYSGSELTELQLVAIQMTNSRQAPLESDSVQTDEIAALLKLHYLLCGSSSNVFDHVVVDEGQDLPPLAYEVLREQHCPSESFTILGDINQGIHAYRGLRDWSELNTVFRKTRPDVRPLRENLRSTEQIVAFNNAVLERGRSLAGANVDVAIGSKRAGIAPTLTLCDSLKEHDAAIATTIQTLQRAGHASIAVIAATPARAARLNAQLGRLGVRLEQTNETNGSLVTGVAVYSAHAIKGLEFAAVLLSEATREAYDANSPIWSRTLYVALSRALHHLEVFSTKPITPLLSHVTPLPAHLKFQRFPSDNSQMGGSSERSQVISGVGGNVVGHHHTSGDVTRWGADPRDATIGIGHFARDNGQYGSPASHDDYSEESGPD